MSQILFEQFCAFLHFGPYIYTYSRLGPDVEELTDVPDDQKIQKDYPDTRRTLKDVPGDQKPSEDKEDYEDLSGSHPFEIEYLLGIAC